MIRKLTNLCYDYFRDVYLDFALGMSKGQKIQRLIEYCGHREAIPKLLAAMAAERTTLYAGRFGAPVETVVPAAEPSRPGRDPRQVFVSTRTRTRSLRTGWRATCERPAGAFGSCRTASSRARSGWTPSNGVRDERRLRRRPDAGCHPIALGENGDQRGHCFGTPGCGAPPSAGCGNLRGPAVVEQLSVHLVSRPIRGWTTGFVELA